MQLLGRQLTLAAVKIGAMGERFAMEGLSVIGPPADLNPAAIVYHPTERRVRSVEVLSLGRQPGVEFAVQLARSRRFIGLVFPAAQEPSQRRIVRSDCERQP